MSRRASIHQGPIPLAELRSSQPSFEPVFHDSSEINLTQLPAQTASEEGLAQSDATYLDGGFGWVITGCMSLDGDMPA